MRSNWWAPRKAPHAARMGVPLEDLLRCQLAGYRARAPSSAEPLPLEVSVNGGAIVVTPVPDDQPVARTAEPAAEPPAVDAADDEQRREAEEEEKRLNDRLAEEQGEIDAARGALREMVRDGGAAPGPRPSVASVAPLLAGLAAVVAGGIAEAYQFGLPYLDAIGVDTRNLRGELAREPLGIIAGFAFAVAAAAAISTLAHWVYGLARSLDRGQSSWRRALALVGLALALGGIVLGTVVGIAGMRHVVGDAAQSLRSAGTSPGDSPMDVFLWVTAAMPIAIAHVTHILGGRWRQRREQVDQRRNWEEAVAVPRRARERLQQVLSLLEAEHRESERARDAARARRLVVVRKPADAVRSTRDSQSRRNQQDQVRRRLGESFVRAMVAALERDRLEYLVAVQRYARKTARPRIGRALVALAVVLPVLLAAAAVLAGCGAAPAAPLPLHTEIVCPVDAGGRLLCPASERAAALAAWSDRALAHPGSRLTLWGAGMDRRSVRRRQIAEVPHHWGGGVLAAKAALLQLARTALATDDTDRDDVVSFSHDCAALPGETTLIVLGDTAVRLAPRAEPMHLAVVCDLSDSVGGLACTPGVTAALFDRWLAGGLAPRASFTIQIVARSRDGVSAAFAATVPDVSPGATAAFALATRAELAHSTELSMRVNASAIAEALHVAASDLREQPGRHALVLLSDLRQVTNGAWNFERSIPSAGEFVSWLKQRSLVAPLRDVELIVCGLHHGHAPSSGPWDAAMAAQLEQVWRAAFREMGAHEPTIVKDCDQTALTLRVGPV